MVAKCRPFVVPCRPLSSLSANRPKSLQKCCTCVVMCIGDMRSHHRNNNDHCRLRYHHHLPATSGLQTKLRSPQSSFTKRLEGVQALEGVIAEHDAIKCEVSLLRQVEKSTATQDREPREEDFGGVGGLDDNHAMSICTTVQYVLERVEDEGQMTRQVQQQQGDEMTGQTRKTLDPQAEGFGDDPHAPVRQ